MTNEQKGNQRRKVHILCGYDIKHDIKECEKVTNKEIYQGNRQSQHSNMQFFPLKNISK